MHRRLKVVSISVIAPFITVLIILVGARLYYNDSRIKSILERYASEALDSHVNIDSLSLSGWVDIELFTLAISDNGGSQWFGVERMKFTIVPWSLLTKKLHIESAEFNNAHFDYGLISLDGPVGEGEAGMGKALQSPLEIVLDNCNINNFIVTGPEADLLLDLAFSEVQFSDLNDFSLSFDIIGRDGKINYISDSLTATAFFKFSTTGYIASMVSTSQDLKLSFEDIRLTTGESYDIGNADIILETTSDLGRKAIVVDRLRIDFDGEKLLSFAGLLDLKGSPELELTVEPVEWRLARFNDLFGSCRLPLKLSGNLSWDEGRFRFSTAGIMYDFAIGVSKLGAVYGRELEISGIDGQIYSDGDLDEIIFGSTLSIDSVQGTTADGASILLEGIRAAVDAEITKTDINLNITSGIDDILGGEFDLSGFSENSKISGGMKIANVNLAEVSSRATGQKDTTIFGLFDLNVVISGVLDSIQTDISARGENVIITAKEDTVYLGDQDFEMTASTIIRDGLLKLTAKFSADPLIHGDGEIEIPITLSAGDSITVGFNMDINNSLIPKYIPSSLSVALGPLDISGQSGFEGRLSSHIDSIALRGITKLMIEPTDILIEDFQSLLYHLVSVSEIQLNDKGVSILSSADIRELYSENYSDLIFPDVSFTGEIISYSDTAWRLTNFVIRIPSLNTTITIAGEFGQSGDIQFSNMTARLKFHSEEPVALSSALSIRGDVLFNIDTFLKEDIFEYSGNIDIRDVSLTIFEEYFFDDINGRIPVEGKINLRDSLFVGDGYPSTSMESKYIRDRIAGLISTAYGYISIGRIVAGPVLASDLDADILLNGGILETPYFSGDVLGGNFIGRLQLDLNEVNIMREFPDYDNLKYDFSMEMAALDFNQLVYEFGPFESKADFSADLRFGGRGVIAPGEDFSIAGTFNISEMGRDVANRILDVMDPENQNPAVAETRALLNRKFLGIIDISYRPTAFSFEIKHGAVYPRLFMDQPFFADAIPILRIPMPVKYGRIPIKTIVNNLKESSW